MVINAKRQKMSIDEEEMKPDISAKNLAPGVYNDVLDYYKAMSNQSPEKLVHATNPQALIKNLMNDPKSGQKLELQLESSFCVTYMILNDEYRNLLAKNRLVNGKRSANGDIKSSSMGKVKTESTKKLKFDAVPSYMMASGQKGVKMAVAAFLVNQENIRRQCMFAVANDSRTKTVANVVEECSKPHGEIKQFIAESAANSTEKVVKRPFVFALVMLAHLLKSTPCSKLAYDLSKKHYMDAISHNINKGADNPLSNKEAYEPLVSNYIKQHVAPINQAQQRNMMALQTKTALFNCISEILKTIDEEEKKRVSISPDAPLLNPKRIYEYFYSSNNFVRDIVTTYQEFQNKRYQVLLYNECLFDVHGSTTVVEGKDGESILKQELFDDISWSQRLEKLDMTKINLKIDSGENILSSVPSGSDVMVSWVDKKTGLSNSKTVHIKKRTTKVKSEPSSFDSNNPMEED